MKSKIFWLRLAYWWGIIVDGVMAVLMLIPPLYLRFTSLNLKAEAGFAYGLLNAAPLMIGWTILLLWADRKPVERKAILPLTLPVIAGYVSVEVYALFIGVATLGSLLPTLAAQAVVSALFIYGYLNASTQAGAQAA